ncbi:MAG: hypothetical protein ACREVK_08510 [Gammaproteobacteria bacterium]
MLTSIRLDRELFEIVVIDDWKGRMWAQIFASRANWLPVSISANRQTLKLSWIPLTG